MDTVTNSMESTGKSPVKKVGRPKKTGTESKKSSVTLSSATHSMLGEILSKLNKDNPTKRIRYDDVVSYALNLIKTSDHEKILQASLTPEDKVDLEYHKWLKKQDKHYTMKEWIAIKMKLQ